MLGITLLFSLVRPLWAHSGPSIPWYADSVLMGIDSAVAIGVSPPQVCGIRKVVVSIAVADHIDGRPIDNRPGVLRPGSKNCFEPVGVPSSPAVGALSNSKPETRLAVVPQTKRGVVCVRTSAWLGCFTKLRHSRRNDTVR